MLGDLRVVHRSNLRLGGSLDLALCSGIELFWWKDRVGLFLFRRYPFYVGTGVITNVGGRSVRFVCVRGSSMSDHVRGINTGVIPVLRGRSNDCVTRDLRVTRFVSGRSRRSVVRRTARAGRMSR